MLILPLHIYVIFFRLRTFFSMLNSPRSACFEESSTKAMETVVQLTIWVHWHDSTCLCQKHLESEGERHHVSFNLLITFKHHAALIACSCCRILNDNVLLYYLAFVPANQQAVTWTAEVKQ